MDQGSPGMMADPQNDSVSGCAYVFGGLGGLVWCDGSKSEAYILEI